MVWFRYLKGGQSYWSPNDDKDGFVFINKNGLSLAQIPEQFVGAADVYRCGCSDCGDRRKCFERASAEEIEIWNKAE